MINIPKSLTRKSALRAFLSSGAVGGILLMVAAALAVIIANSVFAKDYTHLIHAVIGPELTPQAWANDSTSLDQRWSYGDILFARWLGDKARICGWSLVYLG